MTCLTPVTSASERKPKPGFENKVPRAPKEFYDYWINSPEYEAFLFEIEDYGNSNAIGEESEQFKQCFWYLIRDEARPIVEKHKTYALYRPSADVFASIITELPTKVCVVLSFNLIFCFMANFNRRTGSFSFFYLLVNFIATISMSHLFITAATTSLSEAMTPVSVLFWICLFLPVLLSQLQICTAGVVGSTILIQLAMLLKV